MVVDWNIILSKVGATAVYSAIISIVLGGGLSYFKPWLVSEEDVRKTTRLKKEEYIEKLATILKRLMLQARDFEIPLRGDPPHHDDVIAIYVSEHFRLLKISGCLDAVYNDVKNANTVLFLTVFAGLACFIIALPFESVRPYIALIGYMIIGLQGIMVFKIRALAKRLEEYEHAT